MRAEPVEAHGCAFDRLRAHRQAHGAAAAAGEAAEHQHHQPADHDGGHRRAQPGRGGEADGAGDGRPQVGPAGDGPGVDELVRDEAAGPGDHRHHPQPGPVGDVPALAADREEVHGGDGEQRHEHRADQEQERLVLPEVQQPGQQGGDHPDDHGDDPPVEPGQQVLHRHRGRVDVGEGLVHLVDQQDADGDGAGRQGDQRGDHVAGPQVGHGQDAEDVVRHGGQPVAEGRAAERRLPGPGVTAVVGGQRGEGDHPGHGQVDPGPEAEHGVGAGWPAAAAAAPRRTRTPRRPAPARPSPCAAAGRCPADGPPSASPRPRR